jgi:diguanylate cyclase (GGDEF)-like protein
MADARRVLVIDADEETRTHIEGALREEGYVVEGVRTGDEALRRVRSAVAPGADGATGGDEVRADGATGGGEPATHDEPATDDAAHGAADAGERDEATAAPEIVIIGLEHCGGDGVALTREIRRLFYSRALQIVLMTDRSDEETLRRAMDVGADDYVGKPMQPLEVKLRVRAAAIRLREQLDLIHEREFYRQAAREEEQLSARVLDQNVHLRRAYDRIEEQNRDLARMNRQLQRVARYDSLSGLMNRMSLFHVLDVEIERSLRSNSGLCILMIDIDHFKIVNDERGHACGDALIRRIGEILRNERRKYDYAGRYGGEEFLMVLPNTALADAAVVADRVRARFGEEAVECDGASISVTASIGVARFRSGETRDMWISRADRAMYVAKQRGRNRVELEVDG